MAAAAVDTNPIELAKFGFDGDLAELVKQTNAAAEAAASPEGEHDDDDKPKAFDVNALDKDGCTGFFWAVRNGHLKTVKFLLEECNATIDQPGASPSSSSPSSSSRRCRVRVCWTPPPRQPATARGRGARTSPPFGMALARPARPQNGARRVGRSLSRSRAQRGKKEWKR